MTLARSAALALLLIAPGQICAQAPDRAMVAGPQALAQGGSPSLSGIDFLQARTWTALLTLRVADKAERDRRAIPDNRRFVSVSVCSLRDTVRIRSASIQFENGRWQRLVLPQTLRQGECSRGNDLISAPRRLRAIQFDYETVSPGRHRGEILLRGRLAK